MDLQIILIFILALLTINLLVVGLYIILVLREFRQTVKKANAILEVLRKVAGAASSPLVALLGAVSGIAGGVKAVRSIFDREEVEDE